MRSVVVTSGASEPRGLVITDLLGNDLSTCDFQVALVKADATPAPDDYADVTPVFSESNTVATVRVQVSSGNVEAGSSYREWVLMVDGLDTFALPAPEVITAA